MPIYEYQCKACQHEFEREQRITADPIKKCPHCGALQARRLISRTSFVLKGGGWYSDLYSSQGSGKDSGGDAAKSEASKTDSSKTDSSKTDSSKTDASKPDSGKKDAPKADSGGKDGGSPGKGSTPGKGSSSSKGKGKGGAQAAA